MAFVNRHILLEYAVAGPRLWHERMLLEWIGGEEYVVVTPDRDVYIEDISLTNSDLRTIRVRPGPGLLPDGVVGAEVYPLPVWNAAELSAIRAEGQQLALQERNRRGGGQAGVVAPVAAGAAVAAPGGEDEHRAGQLKWLAAETIGAIRYGDSVQGVAAGLARGAKSVHAVPNGPTLFVECVDGGELDEFFSKPGASDFRTLKLVLNGMGQPEQSLREISVLCREVPVKWSLPGPRTAKWCINYLAVEGLGFEGHHERLRQVCKVDASAWGIQEHFQVSMAVRQSLLVDQLDGCNLVSIELQFRRLQTIEFSYAEKAREFESRAVGGKLSLEEQTSFGGVTRQFATLMICPDLLEHVKAETEREASLAKNLRKAREERESARKAAAKKKGQPGHAEQDP